MATTTEVTKSTAAAKVFDTFELLEQILIEVSADASREEFQKRVPPVKAIYRLQRVHSTFRDVIVRSKPLRVITFRQHPGNEKTELDHNEGPLRCSENGGRALNPLFPVFKELISIPSFSWACMDQPDGVLGWMFAVEATSSINERTFSVASWRNSLLFHKPLLQKAKVVLRYGGRTRECVKIELEEEPTLGQLADIIVELVKMAEEADRRECRGLIY